MPPFSRRHLLATAFSGGVGAAVLLSGCGGGGGGSQPPSSTKSVSDLLGSWTAILSDGRSIQVQFNGSSESTALAGAWEAQVNLPQADGSTVVLPDQGGSLTGTYNPLTGGCTCQLLAVGGGRQQSTPLWELLVSQVNKSGGKPVDLVSTLTNTATGTTQNSRFNANPPAYLHFDLGTPPLTGTWGGTPPEGFTALDPRTRQPVPGANSPMTIVYQETADSLAAQITLVGPDGRPFSGSATGNAPVGDRVTVRGTLPAEAAALSYSGIEVKLAGRKIIVTGLVTEQNGTRVQTGDVFVQLAPGDANFPQDVLIVAFASALPGFDQSNNRLTIGKFIVRQGAAPIDAGAGSVTVPVE